MGGSWRAVPAGDSNAPGALPLPEPVTVAAPASLAPGWPRTSPFPSAAALAASALPSDTGSALNGKSSPGRSAAPRPPRPFPEKPHRTTRLLHEDGLAPSFATWTPPVAGPPVRRLTAARRPGRAPRSGLSSSVGRRAVIPPWQGASTGPPAVRGPGINGAWRRIDASQCIPAQREDPLRGRAVIPMPHGGLHENASHAARSDARLRRASRIRHRSRSRTSTRRRERHAVRGH